MKLLRWDGFLTVTLAPQGIMSHLYPVLYNSSICDSNKSLRAGVTSQAAPVKHRAKMSTYKFPSGFLFKSIFSLLTKKSLQNVSTLQQIVL